MKTQSADSYFSENKENFSEDQFGNIFNQADDLKMKSNKGALKPFLADIGTMFTLVYDYSTGKYCNVPWGSVAAVGVTLLYIISPIDLIPDVIPVLGLTDDAAVLVACLKLVNIDLKLYRKWKNRKNAA